MAKFQKKPVVIEAFTFDEFVAMGLTTATSIVDGKPWAFTFRGHACTHENDSLYLIPTLEGVHNMTPADMLIVGVRGEIYPCKTDIFHETYEAVYSTGQDDVDQHITAALLEEAMKQRAAYTYTTTPGESVMGIALRECGNEQEWRHILACNPQFSAMLPHEYFPVGTVLTLPPKDEAA